MVVALTNSLSLSSDSAATAMAMSATSTPLSSINHHCFRNQSINGTTLFNRNSITNCRTRRRRISILRLSLTHKFINQTSYGGVFTRPLSTVMQWQDCTVKTEVGVPISVAYQCYLDREAIPQWMPFISNVKVLEDKPELSRWSLKYEAFGQNIEYSWLARNMQPILNQKIHWRSLEGLPNRGAVRFFPKGPSSCVLELTVSYEVPQLLSPVASALKPFVESLLGRGLERFATFARAYQE